MLEFSPLLLPNLHAITRVTLQTMIQKLILGMLMGSKTGTGWANLLVLNASRTRQAWWCHLHRMVHEMRLMASRHETQSEGGENKLSLRHD